MKRVFQIAVLLLLPLALYGQDSPKEARKPDAPQPIPSTRPQPQRTAYRVDFKLFEVEDGKRTNQREFSMIASAQDYDPPYATLRVGNRVPVNTGEKGNYIDIGFEGRCRLTDMNGKLSAAVSVEITGLAPSEEGGGTHGTTMPVLRSTRLNIDSVLVPGKPQIIGGIDDLASKKRMQVEVTATRID
ncbi:MAG TPA: hypothetical protein VE783_12680 [Candidatus Limnocylindrales bacterium]|jgi:glucose/arabinose dehydrogenase|nr:hypothetical protein [Candidatus Limnocylindrales bacterium]